MPADISNKLVVAISSRALFNLDGSNAIYEKYGVDSYARYQIQHENYILEPGLAFPLVKKFLTLNQNNDLVEIILLSRNSADTGLRIFNSIQHYQINITRAAFTGGRSPYRYIEPFKAHLFLSANPEDVKQALNMGYAAATILPSVKPPPNTNPELRIAFDGDAVLFSDEAERIYQQAGLSAFTINEKKAANNPLPGGPFKGFLEALQRLQSQFPADQCPIRTALVTARQAPAHERVIKTLRAWNIRIDEALFIGGLEKSNFLRSFGADIFFDDQKGHCQSAAEHVATGHVPNGISNENL
ncbi:5'-nucleotidase [Candidatus Coxiella mudrowiae]|uniref:5'-nucleotidase n=1 Tax=Candidatus Coxiella mudrowiae TaxID=2054173 RepID=A0ABN4HPI5_9COXI|nr:5'-nucleotidase [Candidatus Coxiella mudrowiae]AKQ33607.1 5'-nucleotidase [Candidatus Coxiella mudrowiae]